MTDGAGAAAGSAPLAPTLIVMALPIEAQGLFAAASIPVLFTGLGKVNAALALMRRLMQYRAAQQPLPLVLNFGTAGSRTLATGELVACDRFVQRDMDVSALGFAVGETPYEQLPAQLAFPPLFTELRAGLCGSGDSFAIGAAATHCDVLDMEAYALAKVCLLEQARFACVKYISDGANHSAASDWHDNLPRAAAAFWGLYQRLPGN